MQNASDSTATGAPSPENRSGPKEKAGARKNLRRHARKCSVCRHPNRKEIEQDFLCWQSPDVIAKARGIADHSSVYRHAHAVGLFERRSQTLRLALGPIIERAMTVRVTADAVIRAAIVCINLNSGVQPVTASSPRIKKLIAKVGE
jgi:predicted amidophosphoribosyltransferase